MHSKRSETARRGSRGGFRPMGPARMTLRLPRRTPSSCMRSQVTSRSLRAASVASRCICARASLSLAAAATLSCGNIRGFQAVTGCFWSAGRMSIDSSLEVGCTWIARKAPEDEVVSCI
jgi:hypothetical protein